MFGPDVYMESWVATPAFFNPYPTSASAWAGKLGVPMRASSGAAQGRHGAHFKRPHDFGLLLPLPFAPCTEVYPESTVAPYSAFKGVSAPKRAEQAAPCEAV